MNERLKRLMAGAAIVACAGLPVFACGIEGSEDADSTGSALGENELSIFSATDAPSVASDSDTAAVEVGVRFRADVAGTLNGLRFFKGSANTGTHVGHLWTNTGTLLASVTFTGETASGWQLARFASPVAIQPNVTYVASYHTDVGRYGATNDAFATTGIDRGPLHALRDNQDGRNGVYRYGASGFPVETYRASNYFVDVLFQPSGGGTPECSEAPIASVRASGDDGNVPANAIDGSLATRWSNLGKGSFLQADLGSAKTVCSASVAWYSGTTRRSTFRVMLSTDGTTFTQAFAGQSSGTTNALQTYALSPTTARFVRIVVDGNTLNDWASITELRVGASAAAPSDGGAPPPPPPPPPDDGGTSSGPCTVTATTGTFAAQFSAAQPGAVMCLAAGNYGTWRGGTKAGVVTVKPQTGATVTMTLDFNGATNLRLEGVTLSSARLVNATKNITIAQSRFTGPAVIDGVANSNILFDGNQHVGIMTCSTCFAGMINLPYDASTHSGVTIQRSLFADGNADGIQAGTGVNIVGNEFRNLHENGPSDPAHTDPIQLIGAKGSLVRGNWIHHCADGIVAYDGIDHATIEDNVVDLVNGRWGIELSSDNGSVVRHNTLRYATTCEYAACGHIMLDHKSADPAGQGTIIVDNIATSISLNNGSTAAQISGNMLREAYGTGNAIGTPVFVGGAAPTTFPGFKLAAGSPGKAAASDGLDVGIR